MGWSIVEVARMSGVTARRLRHYDEIGLLRPAWIGTNGYRYYGEEELLRLQEILVLRELGMGLAEIGRILAEETDQLTALLAHHERLLDEAEHLTTLAATVARTISALRHAKESGMPTVNRPENLFEGFDRSQWEQAALEWWPEEFERAQEYAIELPAGEMERVQRETTARMIRMAEFMTSGMPVDDPAVQGEVAAAYEWMAQFWPADRSAFTALGRTYVEDERFRPVYDAIVPGLAEYYRDAMTAYANARLA